MVWLWRCSRSLVPDLSPLPRSAAAQRQRQQPANDCYGRYTRWDPVKSRRRSATSLQRNGETVTWPSFISGWDSSSISNCTDIHRRNRNAQSPIRDTVSGIFSISRRYRLIHKSYMTLNKLKILRIICRKTLFNQTVYINTDRHNGPPELQTVFPLEFRKYFVPLSSRYQKI